MKLVFYSLYFVTQHSIVADYPFDVKADFEPLLNVLEGLVSNTINRYVNTSR